LPNGMPIDMGIGSWQEDEDSVWQFHLPCITTSSNFTM
jgi:hypothetical protein